MDDDIQGRIQLFQLRVMAVITVIVTFGFFAVIAALMMLQIQEDSHEVLLVMLGSLGTAWTGILTWYFGSSLGSHLKDVRDKFITLTKGDATMKSISGLIVIIGLSLTLSGCGVTLDKIKQVASDAIDAGGKIYDTITGGAAEENTSKDIVKPSEQK
jgi:hypothetical protein